MKNTAYQRPLTKSEEIEFSASQASLRQEGVDIRFRTYDLLFKCYPDLASELSENRYQHPDIVGLLSNKSQRHIEGKIAVSQLIALISPSTRRQLSECLTSIRHCLLRAVREIMFDEINPTLLEAYAKMIEQHTNTLLSQHSTGFVNNYIKTPYCEPPNLAC